MGEKKVFPEIGCTILPLKNAGQFTAVRLYSDLRQIESSKSYKEVNTLSGEARLKESNIKKG